MEGEAINRNRMRGCKEMSEMKVIEIGIVAGVNDMGNSEEKRRYGGKKNDRKHRGMETMKGIWTNGQRKKMKPNYETRSDAMNLIMK